MSNPKRYTRCGMSIVEDKKGGWVEYSDYAALEAERERLRAQVSALQSDANSWQSGYDKGREDGAKAAEGWKAQHARDSAELRRLCAERDQQWRIRRDVEADRDTANAVSSELRAQRDALAAELEAIKRQEVVDCKVVPVDLIERTICRLTHGHEHDKAVRELRALLAGAEGVKDE